MTEIHVLSADDLSRADEGSWYTIAGCGGDLNEWVEGYQKMLTDQAIGTPTGWFQTTGEAVNEYAERKNGGSLLRDDAFPNDLIVLMFPLDGLDIGRLAMLKMQAGDRWFDDVVANMRDAWDA